MPGERVGSVHVDQLLSNLAVLYRPADDGFIADQVCPMLPVQHESDLYVQFTQDDFYATDVDDLVPDRGEAREVEFGHSNKRYAAQRRELAWTITDRERANADDQLRLERTRQVGTLGRLLLKREARVAALLRKTTNGGQLTNGAAAAADWGASGTTTVESDIITGIESVRQSIGFAPNVIVVPFHVAVKMNQNAQLRDWLKYNVWGGPNGNPLEDQTPVLPGVLFGMRVITPKMIQNTAHEGQAGSYTDVWGNHVRLLYVTNGPAIEQPSVAYSFQSEPLTTRRARDDKRRLDWFATGFTLDERVVAPLAGYEISSATT